MQVRALFDRGIKLLLNDLVQIVLLRPSRGAILVFAGEMKCCPCAEFVFVIGEEFHLLWRYGMHKGRSAMWINRVNLLSVVLLSVHKSDKQTTRFRTEHVLQDSRIKVVLQLVIMSHRVLAITHQPSVAAATGRTSFLELVVRRVGEPQH